jgi:FtsP/CotA-like multicopper oxidase with cupredoxin domain
LGVPIVIAALAMSLSSVSVVANALRLGAINMQETRAGRHRAGAFDLRIGANRRSTFTGRRTHCRAITVNGVPARPDPALARRRHGDLRVRNRWPTMTSIHWHGILLPANMDGVPGLSFHGIEPGETTCTASS